jgi:Replication-relaxation
MSAKLTMRDTAVILDVHKYRYLTATQIEKLHFPSMQMAWRRLHILTTLGFLKAFTTPNINERIFYLGKQGAEVSAGLLRIWSTITSRIA